MIVCMYVYKYGIIASMYASLFVNSCKSTDAGNWNEKDELGGVRRV